MTGALAPARGLPEETLRALAAGGGGEDAARVLRAGQDARRLLLLRGLLDAAEPGPHGPAALTAWRVLTDVRRRAPTVFAAVVGYPSVGPAARRALRQAMQGDPSEAPSLLCALATTAALRANLRTTLTIPLTSPHLTLPSAGTLTLPPMPPGTLLEAHTGNGAEIRLSPTRPNTTPPTPTPTTPETSTPGPAAPGVGGTWASEVGGTWAFGWAPVRALSAGEGGEGITVVLDETDPDRMPGGALRAARMTAAEAARFGALLEDAWALLLRRHWTVAAEARVLLRAFTVLDAPHGRSTSGTPRHASGMVGLSPPVDAPGLAETIAHEIQHTKLNAVLDHHALTGPDDGARYRVPWRPDPRPLLPALHGVYAHLGVAGFWRRERRSGPRAEAAYTRWRAAAHSAALELAESPSLTPEGRLLLKGTTTTLASWTP
ncbi:aKG-HExxH-type peptide beta-hydroxylase [Actinocorallia sp. A-T 12471]|uniref:aKG-HExxH-type peptide beta-hydroxylase n=1 Tax=Actinocorallia sp. A-T 12471 TaxID=3089813 RepID=UPI0029D3449F|nr:HEXXH motif-containing putative peptide modification protein [Actinocorallia sp. A-T 12471]MDX6742049.1 HEXXH motif-containing putative peptide modification protein [Actinocorallia sp. A-T 12471]